MKSLTALLSLLAMVAAAMAQDGVLEVRGRATKDHPAYRGGKVEFLGFDLLDQVVHYARGAPLPLRLRIRYRVLETAPILLNSRFGTEYWRLCHYSDGQFIALHSTENIDLSKLGEAETITEAMTVDPKWGELPAKGLTGFRGRHYFLVDQANGRWLATVDPPAVFRSPELAARLIFTLADLSTFRIELSALQSTWQPGGPLRFRAEVVDAAGERFPVVSATSLVSAGGWRASAEIQLDPHGSPSGWMETALPADAVPEQVEVSLTASCMAPDGPRKAAVSRSFQRGIGQVAPAELHNEPPPQPQARNAAGVLRETRALWVQRSDILTRAGADDVVRRARQAGLNVLVPNITSRNTLATHSDLLPLDPGVEPGLDPLAYLLERAHAAGLEVHPWFTCTYRDAKGRAAAGGNVDIIDAQGKAEPIGACSHRPAYRDFITRLMIGVARDYPVDGIHFDYIRVMSNCYCDACRREFQTQFGKPLTDATPDDWQAWNRQAIGDVVQRVASGVRQLRPQAILSAAVFENLASGAAQGQDPGGWANRGWLDMVIPMDYDTDSLLVRAAERRFLAILDQDDKLVTGLSLYVRDGETASGRDPQLMVQQIRLVRQLGIHGYCLFVSPYLDDARLDSLQNAINTEPAAPYFR